MGREQRQSLQLGLARLQRGDVGGAVEALEQVLAACPGYADVHYLVGLAHERTEDLAAATTSFERALEINPAYAECSAALASVYERRGLFERSRAVAQSAAARAAPAPGGVDATTRGKLANLHAALGDAYREAGEPREAIEQYRKALDRAPRFHDIRQRLGVALREAGLPSQAVTEFRRVLRGNPSYLEAAVQLGLTCFTMGRPAEAVRAFETVLGRDPSREDARMYLRMLRRADGPASLAEPTASPGGAAPGETRAARGAGSEGWAALHRDP
jgi:tetratricopeptide (TPR) repeat protein